MFIEASFIISRCWKGPRCPSTEESIQKMWCIYSYQKQFHEILRQLDRTRKYHLEWDFPITEAHTWYVLTYKWILDQKLGITKIQFIDHMKLKKRKTKVWVLGSFLERGTKYLLEQIWRQCVEQRLPERPYRDCPIWGSIPYTITKPRHYSREQEMIADRSLI